MPIVSHVAKISLRMAMKRISLRSPNAAAAIRFVDYIFVSFGRRISPPAAISRHSNGSSVIPVHPPGHSAGGDPSEMISRPPGHGMDHAVIILEGLIARPGRCLFGLIAGRGDEPSNVLRNLWTGHHC